MTAARLDASSNRTDRPFGDFEQQTGHPVFAHANEDAIPNSAAKTPPDHPLAEDSGAGLRPGPATPKRAVELSDLEREGLDLVAQHFGWEKPNPDATRNRVVITVPEPGRYAVTMFWDGSYRLELLWAE